MIITTNPVGVIPPAASVGTGNNVNAAANNNNVNYTNNASYRNANRAGNGNNAANANNAQRFDRGINAYRAEGFGVNANTDSVITLEEFIAYENAQQLAAAGTPESASTTAQNTVQDTTSLDAAILLNLSPQALNLLNGVEPAGNLYDGEAYLTVQQQQEVANIATEFSNAPFNQNTFIGIQSALTNAGINPNDVPLQALLQGTIGVTAPYATDNELLTTELTDDLLAA